VTYIADLALCIRQSVSSDVGIPEEADLLFLLYAVLARAKGRSVNAEDVHDAWVAWMENQGRYHSSMIEFGTLDDATREADEPFVRAIHEAVSACE
jgi:hypothetical protein